MKNSVNLIGRIASIKTLRFENAQLTNVFLAINNKYVDKTTGEEIENAHFFNLVGKTKISELLEKYFVIGDQLAIKGFLTTRKWNKDDVEITSTEIVITQIVFEACINNRKVETEITVEEIEE